MANSQCDDVLNDSLFRVRVDFPLIRGGTPVGKLSCDLNKTCVTSAVSRRLRYFWRHALRAADSLAALRSARIDLLVPVTNNIRDRLSGVSDLGTFFDFCVDELPKEFKIRHASIFTLSSDATNSVRLILRRTSYPDSRSLEHGASDAVGRQGYYQLSPNPDNAITTWVARTGRSVRLQDLSNGNVLVRQLQVLDSTLRWMNKIQDSTCHTSFLAVPIMAGGETLGVLRFTEKGSSQNQSHFTDVDEGCLCRIASDYIGPKLAELQRNESKQIFCAPEWRRKVVKGLAETFRPVDEGKRDRRQASFRLAMKEVFGERGASRHLCLVNVVPPNARRFSHLSASGRLAASIQNHMGRTYDLEGTLTGCVIRDWRPIYLHDLERAKKLGLILPLLPEAESVLACPIAMGDAGIRGNSSVFRQTRYFA